ncbi:MAG TPA: maltose alpha-D-glucosyltransferase [Terracidiphilus sp.]|nr:maltose alpha-D-glucosyltransferase [Terracidiphilus sp.]
MKKLASATDPLWYKDAIIYELHVRAFADSNGDGIGDFPGLLSRLDYLQELGVTCIWLLPFFPSPLRDDGYDIANYVDVNPSYGTLNDFKAFLDAAHQRNMQVMIELVINHTSDQHPWFKAARLAPPGSPQRDMYVWSDTDHLYKEARIIFTDTEKSNWTWDDTAKAFYWHRFFSHQPDLNFDNPMVIEEVLKAMRFWLDMGVDAMRMDAIPYLRERDGTNCENLPETHLIIKGIRAAIDEDYANRLVLAEANQWPADVRPYFGEGDECHMAFHFPLMPRIYMALRQEDRLPITDIMAQTPPIPDSCQWGLFLRNHDELTLEMVTDDERDYMYFAYSGDPRMRVNVGIRRRLAPLVDNNRRRIELLNSILLSFPGTPILYYGDEIGMGDNIYLGDRNGVRTPMQWTSDRNAGFSRCDPARLYFPVIMDPIYGYQVVNVEAQLSDQSSLLHWTRNMIALRKLFQVFGRGSLTFLNPANRKVLAYLRDMERPDGSHETVLCVANLSRFAQPVSLDLALFVGLQPVEMLGYVSFPAITDGPYSLTLAPYSFLWLELQPASEPIEALPEPLLESADPFAVEQIEALSLLAHGWSAWLAGQGSSLLAQALPEWLPRQRWFGAKSRSIQSVHIMDWVEIPAAAPHEGAQHAHDSAAAGKIPPALLFIEITYSSGTSDLYQIPLAISTGVDGEEIVVRFPQSVVATFHSSAGTTVLHDATIREETRQSLLALIQTNATLGLSTEREATHLVAGDAGPDTPTPLSNDPGAAAGLPVAPVPISAQPGEAAAPPRSTSPAPSSAQRMQPRESPSAGNPAPQGGRLDAHSSLLQQSVPRDLHLESRVGSAEQSNTSILYGQRLILKLFRRLQPGENPDVEIGRFLTEVARFPRIAPFMGEITLTTAAGEATTTAMLQQLVANEGDGWSWFREQLAVFFPAFADVDAPATAKISLLHLPLPDPGVRKKMGGSLEAAALLGRRTAEMHLALATSTQDQAFCAEEMRADDLARDGLRVEAQLAQVIETLKAKVSSLDESNADLAIQLLARRRELSNRARALGQLNATGKRIRIHGDYHLGQTLRTPADGKKSAGDFVILDFEGEPARSLVERRQKQSPLKDVAGMIRSFSYAAYSGLDRYLTDNAGSDAERARSWARCWENLATVEFLRSYTGTMAAKPELLPSLEQAEPLLDAYILEKALYELLYELNNRPQWLRIPFAGILAL